jgi:hypothetical protein
MKRLREMSEERMQGGMPPAIKGTLVLADRAGNRRLFITFFDSGPQRVPSGRAVLLQSRERRLRRLELALETPA